MPKCEQCGKGFSYAKADIKSGKIEYPELCHFCQKPKSDKIGLIDRVGKVEKKKKNKYFKSDGWEGEKRTDDDEMAEVEI